MDLLKNVNRGVSLNFNLREPKKVNGQTQLYAVVKLNGKQLKMSIGCKVNAWNWDSKRQIPRFSNSMSTQDIENVLQINNVINDVRNGFYSYICSGEPITESAIKEIICTSNNNQKTIDIMATPPIRTKTASVLIRQAFENRYGTEKAVKEISPKSFATYTEWMKDFYKFLKSKYTKDNLTAYDSIRMLKLEGVDLYESYLTENKKGGRTTIVQKRNLIALLINDIAKTHKYKEIEKIERIAKPNHSDDEDRKAIALKKEQKDKFLNYDFATKAANAKTEREKKRYKNYEVYRDFFKMQLESGARFEDVIKLFYTEKYGVKKMVNEDGEEKQVFKTDKSRNTKEAFVDVTATIKELQKKYEKGLPFTIANQALNTKLKEMFEIAGITEEYTYMKEDEHGNFHPTKARICDSISSHWARHTFITEKVLEGWDLTVLCDLTGHVDDEMIKKVYGRLREDKQKEKRIDLQRKRIKNEKAQTTTTKQTNAKELFELWEKQKENDLIRECKDVLLFLGVQYTEIADINDIDRLMYLVYHEHYKPFEQMGIDTLKLKEIYNKKDLTFKDKVSALKKVIEQAKKRIQAEKDINTM